MKNTNVDLNYLLTVGSIDNELDFERAMIIDRELRLLVKEHPNLAEKRKSLRAILKKYEDRVWNVKSISDEDLAESDLAELVAEQERLFFKKRKELIKDRLKAFSLSQKDLGKILGHSSVTYISELVSGVNPFTIHNLVIIHLLLKIDFQDLIPTMLTIEERKKIANAVGRLGIPQLAIDEHNMELIISSNSSLDRQPIQAVQQVPGAEIL